MTMSTLKVTLLPELSEKTGQEAVTKIKNLDGVLRTKFDAAANTLAVAYNPNCTQLEERIRQISGVASAKYYPY